MRPTKKSVMAILLAFLSIFATVATVAPTAHADVVPPLTLKVGDGISQVGPLLGQGDYGENGRVNGQCTVGALGLDDAGRKIMITAGHCVDYKTDVIMVKGGLKFLGQPQIKIGRSKVIFQTIDPFDVNKKSNKQDVAVIQLDDWVQFNDQGLTVTEPTVGDSVYRLGNGLTSPYNVSGVVSKKYDNDFVITSAYQASTGDSGGPVIKGNQLLGIINRNYTSTPLPWEKDVMATRLDVIVNQLNARGGIGAGFHSAPGVYVPVNAP